MSIHPEGTLFGIKSCLTRLEGLFSTTLPPGPPGDNAVHRTAVRAGA
jgi:hypothetical protein